MNRRAGHTERIARFVTRVRLRSIPHEVRERAKEHLLDGLATMLGGAAEPASGKIRSYLARLDGKGEATVLGSRLKLPCQNAALANGVQGHVLDYDDAQLATYKSRPFGQQTHPTVPVLAAALATGEKLRSSGADLLAAYIAGVEVACRLADAIDPEHYLGGFHPTGTIAVFGAAAACCHLLRLNEVQTRCALGIAGSLASGLRANRGTMTKALNAGRGAENGVLAAALAADGFSASTNIFEDPMGFFSAAAKNKVDGRLLSFGRPYFFVAPGIAIKAYPCPVVLHPVLDAVVGLALRYDIGSQDIKRITIGMGPRSAAPLVYSRPQNGLQAKFSLAFSVAAAAAERRVGLEQYQDEKVRDRRIQTLMRRVELQPDSRLDGGSEGAAPARVEILLQDGTRHRAKTTWPSGHPKKPLSRQSLEEKFRECARSSLGAKKGGRVIQAVWSVETLPSMAGLIGLVKG
jgi:2-methylcitrate dehydratase PrpD